MPEPSWFDDGKIDYNLAPSYLTVKKEQLVAQSQKGGIEFNSHGQLDAHALAVLQILAAGDIELRDFAPKSELSLITALSEWQTAVQEQVMSSQDTETDISDFDLWQIESARKLLIELGYASKHRP